MDHFLKILPKLTPQLRKGDCGRIAVIGGSLEYTGAPFFAASSVARLGADLIHVFCTPDAAPVIKGFSPDLIVHPGMSSSSILPKLSRMDAIVIGPGLGRNPNMWALMEDLFQYVKEQKVPFVIDGDGLWFVSEHIEKFPRQMVTTVLTPNFFEFSRLCKAALGEEDVTNVRSHTQLQHLAAELSRKMDVTIYMKGEVDLVVTPNGEVSKCSTDSSLRRCGGQGDVTAGSLGLFLFWAQKNLGDDWTSAHHEAGIAASWLVRTAGRRAFEKHGRSMNTPTMLEEIPKLVRDVETRELKDVVHSDSSTKH